MSASARSYRSDRIRRKVEDDQLVIGDHAGRLRGCGAERRFTQGNRLDGPTFVVEEFDDKLALSASRIGRDVQREALPAPTVLPQVDVQ
ncbi:MAG: hypothetical protein IH897_00505 [Planctomycetes bacterium]|nr:hypothetical protein [Planctomycetota bacterium]